MSDTVTGVLDSMSKLWFDNDLVVESTKLVDRRDCTGRLLLVLL